MGRHQPGWSRASDTRCGLWRHLRPCHLRKVPARSAGNRGQVHNTKCHRQFVLARTVAPGATAPTKGSGRSNTEVSTSKQFQTSQTSKDREQPRQMCRGLLPGPHPLPHLFHAQEATAAPEASASLPAVPHMVLGPTVRMERSLWSPKRGRRPCSSRGSFLQPTAGCQPRAPTFHSPNPPRICSAGPSGKAPACSVWHTQPTSRSHPKISKATRTVTMPCQQGPPIARELQRHEAQGREQARGGTTDPGWEGWGRAGRVPRPTGRASALQHWSTSWWQCSLRASSCALSQDTPRNLASCSTIVTRSWNTRAESREPIRGGAFADPRLLADHSPRALHTHSYSVLETSLILALIGKKCRLRNCPGHSVLKWQGWN